MRIFAPLAATLLLLCLAGAALAEPPLPAELADIPRMSGAVVVSTMDMGGNVNAMFQVKGTPGEVADFFNAQLPSQGWTKTMEARQDDGAMVSYNKGDKSLTIGVSSEDEGQVTYTVILNK